MAEMTKDEFKRQFRNECRVMFTKDDVARVWRLMDKTITEQGWESDKDYFLELCRIETYWQTKKRIVTHPESSTMWLGRQNRAVTA